MFSTDISARLVPILYAPVTIGGHIKSEQFPKLVLEICFLISYPMNFVLVAIPKKHAS